MPTVAVDEVLTPVRDLLRREGFEVVSPEEAARAAVLVTTGMEQNVLNIQDVTVGIPIINARGKTPVEVLAAVKDVLGQV